MLPMEGRAALMQRRNEARKQLVRSASSILKRQTGHGSKGGPWREGVPGTEASEGYEMSVRRQQGKAHLGQKYAL